MDRVDVSGLITCVDVSTCSGYAVDVQGGQTPKMRTFTKDINYLMTNHKVDLLRRVIRAPSFRYLSRAVNIGRYRRCRLHYRSKLSDSCTNPHVLQTINFEAQSVRRRVKRLVFSMGSVRTWPAGPARSGKQQEIPHEAGGHGSGAADCLRSLGCKGRMHRS